MFNETIHYLVRGEKTDSWFQLVHWEKFGIADFHCSHLLNLQQWIHLKELRRGSSYMPWHLQSLICSRVFIVAVPQSLNKRYIHSLLLELKWILLPCILFQKGEKSVSQFHFLVSLISTLKLLPLSVSSITLKNSLLGMNSLLLRTCKTLLTMRGLIANVRTIIDSCYCINKKNSIVRFESLQYGWYADNEVAIEKY